MEMKALGLCSSSLQFYTLIAITRGAFLHVYCKVQFALAYALTANVTSDITTSKYSSI